ncbi:hypothetical protein IE81DRAFT_287292 [Ceraceosorus guamensis]|uniref:Uncharacterized protein n=1 Tax=Ceraceosorus guamensis TaxID=1522189 RepID=A0A316W564_9BASI|nr:hypothetical protein IE81DRAFT_287292 [Ceraceosorus guamensis]PWN44258.1 hypothetical protein IE81DRAFT_287292 [Ceraceosorus guamensis]
MLSRNPGSQLIGLDIEQRELDPSLQNLAPRIVFNPKVISPHKHTVWLAGQTVNVKWDPSKLPAELGDLHGEIRLGYRKEGETNEHLKWVLRSNVPMKLGKQEVKLPDDLETKEHDIVVMGDSGNASEPFTIYSKADKQKWAEHLKPKPGAKATAKSASASTAQAVAGFDGGKPHAETKTTSKSKSKAESKDAPQPQRRGIDVKVFSKIAA